MWMRIAKVPGKRFHQHFPEGWVTFPKFMAYMPKDTRSIKMTLLCSTIADWCRKNGAVSEEEYPVVLYGIQVLLNTSLKILGILLIGVILHRLPAVCISMAVFCSMRHWTGGWHSDSHIGCFCTMLLPCVCPSLVMRFTGEWVSWALGGMLLYSIYAVMRYAPCNSKVNPVTNPGILARKRFGGIVELVGIIAGTIVYFDMETRWLVVLPLFINAALLKEAK